MDFSKKYTIPAIATVIATVNLTSCGKYDEGPTFSLRSKKARLVGEWELDKVTGPDFDGSDLDDIDYVFEFEKDGDFDVTITTPGYTYTYYGNTYTYGGGTYVISGEWEWENNKEDIEVEMDGDIQDFEILKLTSKELILEDEYRNEWEFDKVD